MDPSVPRPARGYRRPILRVESEPLVTRNFFLNRAPPARRQINPRSYRAREVISYDNPGQIAGILWAASTQLIVDPRPCLVASTRQVRDAVEGWKETYRFSSRYFHHYIVHIAPWYDLSDASSTFATGLPEASLEQALSFSAILALSAVHMSRTSAPSARTAAEFYHGHCVRLLIDLMADDYGDEDTQGLALASVCLLRSYEILSALNSTEEVDPNRHLQGAYSLAALRSPLNDYLGSGLRAAGFWNYLREDITFSLFRQCPLKIDLERMPLPTRHDTDQDHLNTVSLILGRIINACFSGAVTEEVWTFLFGMLQDWRSGLPPRFAPFAKTDRGLGLALPSIWMLRDYHERLPDLHALLDDGPKVGITEDDIAESLAMDVCGVAFTTEAPPVQVNSFGPIAFCKRSLFPSPRLPLCHDTFAFILTSNGKMPGARFLRAEPARQELVRRLLACRRTIGWPVQRLVADLEAAWRLSTVRAAQDE
ncbi:putative conserved hypothetical protein [Colletotrichum sublineola]|uniref:C6 zinc finger domain-containing protein n=1 Tax=Colletotrichum sublineola TaxID=1173701 RepID=A0A066X5P0_COLSU|nr:putative conserved hypothetical protein [Colletotrichum sublineola]